MDKRRLRAHSKIVKVKALGLTVLIIGDDRFGFGLWRSVFLLQLALGPFLGLFRLFFLACALSLSLSESWSRISSHEYSFLK